MSPCSLVAILKDFEKTGFTDYSLYVGEFNRMLLTEMFIADFAYNFGFLTTEITVIHTARIPCDRKCLLNLPFHFLL